MDERPLKWCGSSYKDLAAMPGKVQNAFGYALGLAQVGMRHPKSKTLSRFKPPTVEILEDYDGDTFRAVYTARYEDVIYVIHCFKKKSTTGIGLPKTDKETIEARLADIRRIESDKVKARERKG